jgi:hypothetical protein
MTPLTYFPLEEREGEFGAVVTAGLARAETDVVRPPHLVEHRQTITYLQLK